MAKKLHRAYFCHFKDAYFREVPSYILDPTWRAEIQGYIEEGFHFVHIPTERPEPIKAVSGTHDYVMCGTPKLILGLVNVANLSTNY